MNNKLYNKFKQSIKRFPHLYMVDGNEGKHLKFVNKVISKIIESSLLDFVREPVINQSNFNFHLDNRRLYDMKVKSPCMLLRDWEGRVVYIEYLNDGGGYGSIARHQHDTPYGSLYDYEINGWREGESDPVMIERWKGVFWEKELPKYLLEKWGIKQGEPKYIIIEERVRNEVIKIIGYNSANGLSSYEYNRSEVKQMMVNFDNGAYTWTHPTTE